MLTFQVFAHPTGLASGYTDVLVLQDSLLPLTTSCCPPTTSCYLPRLPAASHDYPAASHDYLLPLTTPSLRLLGEVSETPYPGPLLRRGDRIKGTMNAQEPDCTKP
jgi:hypothetical protein